MGYFKPFKENQCGYCWILHATKHGCLAIHQESYLPKTASGTSFDFFKVLHQKLLFLIVWNWVLLTTMEKVLQRNSIYLFLGNSEEYRCRLKNENRNIISRKGHRERVRLYPRHQMFLRFHIDRGDEIINRWCVVPG